MAVKQADELALGRVIQSKYEGSQKKLIVISFCALIGALNFGIAIAYSSPSIPSMIKRGVLKSKEEGDWFASLLTIGALLGGPVGGWVLERIGRKWSLTLLSLPFSLGFFVIGTATNSFHCYFGRFLTGIASGMVTVCIPMYIAEISTASMRGILGSCVQLFVTIGIAVAYILGVFFEWRLLANICIVPSVVGGLLTLLIPETPRYLLSKSRKAEAILALKLLRDPHTDVNEECRELDEASDSTEESVTFREMLRKRELSYPLMLIVSVLIFQQLSGINAVMFYTVSIFETAVHDFAYIATVIVGVVQIFATMIAVILADRAGRRKLLQVGGIVTSVALFSFGLYYRLASTGFFNSFMKTWFPVVCLTVYIIGFSLGWGPIPMLLMSEIIPTRCKGIAGSVAVAACWGSAFVVTSQFTALQAVLGNGVFYLFSGFCAISVWFVARYIPETKGKSLEDIEMLFAGKAGLVV